MATLKELQQKYPNTKFNYPPNDNCKYCKGTGERNTKAGISFCICTFVSHEFSELAGDYLAQTAKRLLKKLADRPEADKCNKVLLKRKEQ